MPQSKESSWVVDWFLSKDTKTPIVKQSLMQHSIKIYKQLIGAWCDGKRG